MAAVGNVRTVERATAAAAGLHNTMEPEAALQIANDITPH